jgi:hypothetical protein
LAGYLKPRGEIHLLDSPLYMDAEIEGAARRSRDYFASLGFPEMAEHYFHHRFASLGEFDYKFLYRPKTFWLRFFAGDYPGPAFEFLGGAHLGALLLLVLLNVFLLRFRSADDRTCHRLRWTLALILWGNEVAWHAWNYAVGRWTIQEMLPLHLCSILVWLGALMLVTRNYRIYEFMYLMGIGGGVQALMTPDLGIFGFPHFRFFQTFLSHGLIVTSAIYMTVVEGFRPTWKSGIGRRNRLKICRW